jgi:hypothetical protein
MAAARAAKAEGSTNIHSKKENGANGPIGVGEQNMDQEEVDEVDTTLFPASASSRPTTHTSPSTFFNVLTSTHRKAALPSSTLSMHLPAIGDPDELERRVRTAFGEGVESPDDVVLRARSGRAGTAALAPTIDSKT